MLSNLLTEVAISYSHERTKSFANSAFGNFVRHDVAIAAKKRLTFLPYDLKVKASVGAGNWASVPWLGFFDPLITVSATKGFYVVYLVNAQTEEIFLSLNQGTTAAYQSYGEKNGREYLKRTAVEIAARVSSFANQFDIDAIDLGSEDSLPLGYMAGHAFGRKYHAANLNSELFSSDFELMLKAYEALINLGGTTPSEVMMEEAEATSVVESRQYILSRRIERAPHVRLPVLSSRGAICEACGLDPKIKYNYVGPLKNTPLDVHHSNPIFAMKEGETRRYKIPDDFLVLCPTCHRVIHKQFDTSDIARLKATIKA